MDVSPMGPQAPAPLVQKNVQQNTSPQQAAQRRELGKATQVLNANQAFGSGNELVFMVDKNTHSEIMRVVNRDTQEVVMQIPPDYALRLAEQFQQEDSHIPSGA